jgi:hypothetical protein
VTVKLHRFQRLRHRDRGGFIGFVAPSQAHPTTGDQRRGFGRAHEIKSHVANGKCAHTRRLLSVTM